MQTFYELEAYLAGKSPVVTIGVFDGVHIGHKEILKRIKRAAEERTGESVVVTLHPHPRLVLYPDDNSLKMLHTLPEKIEALTNFGIDKLLVLPFTREFSRLSSDEFIEEVLVKTIRAEHIIIGYDHRFGKNRTGGLEDLRAAAAFYRFGVEEVPPFQIDDANISSTKIRAALLEGKVEVAQRYLGYHYFLSGTVIEGRKLGRTLGYPTANLSIADEKLLPAVGIYAVRVHLADGSVKDAVLSTGFNPTVAHNNKRSFEVYILDFDADLYGQALKVELIQFLREEIKFDSLAQLIPQMAIDVENARQILRNR